MSRPTKKKQTSETDTTEEEEQPLIRTGDVKVKFVIQIESDLLPEGRQFEGGSELPGILSEFSIHSASKRLNSYIDLHVTAPVKDLFAGMVGMVEDEISKKQKENSSNELQIVDDDY